jgi:hypothetical protein
MTHFSTSVDIQASPERVWAGLLEIERIISPFSNKLLDTDNPRVLL